MLDKKEKAIKLACEAYSELVDAGIPEEFVAIINSIAQAHRGTFFGSFGSDAGCFIEFESSNDPLTPVKLRFGVRRYKQSFVARFLCICKETWAIWCGHDSEYEISLKDNEIGKLKDLLRVLR